MKVELHSAADFLANLLRVKQSHSSLPEPVLQRFNNSLQSLLATRFAQHWYPELPTRGSGYRCIRINGKMDPLVEMAGVQSGMAAQTLRRMLPAELTLWIDPDEVAYRIGENGSICVLYDLESARNSPAEQEGGAAAEAAAEADAGSGSGGEEFVMERRRPMMRPQQQQQQTAAAAAAAAERNGGRTPSPAAASVQPSRLRQDSGSQSQSPPHSPQYNGGAQRTNGNSYHPGVVHMAAHHQQHQHQMLRHQHQQHQQQHMYGPEPARNLYQWAAGAGAEESGFAPQLRSQC